ncbi:MAG: potassium transporter Kup [Hyphomicrobiaceae bacterium]
MTDAVAHPAQSANVHLPTAKRMSFLALAVGAIGVVYGDIGTSPLYALKESLNAAREGGEPTGVMVMGVLSLMLWALIIIVTLKYVVLMLRADNQGEGGTLSLMALAERSVGAGTWFIPLLGMAGAALFYGDAIITPAISVLSAVEGLELITPAFTPYILPISLGVIVALFSVQSRGTARVAAWFGPIILFWFLVLAAGGLAYIARVPGILMAFNPMLGAGFLLTHGMAGVVALGAVFLTVTGAEALYADLGHFGRKPIQGAWICIVLPALAINYLGQGALLLTDPTAVESPFYRLYPEWALIPIVFLATLATIIASQAVITGAFSITQQAIQLGLLPRLDIRRTSETEKGQIYMPAVNWILMIAVLFLAASFRNSSALASAYGIAVTGTMVVTVCLATVIAREYWRWPVWKTALVMGPFFLIDCVFLGANALKIMAGGWLPLLVGGALLALMVTWRRGLALLKQKARREELSVAEFWPTLEKKIKDRVPGTAVFLTARPDAIPVALLHNLKHNKVLHSHNIVVCIEAADTPRLPEAERSVLQRISDDLSIVRLRFGFMEEPNVPRALLRRRLGLKLNPRDTSYYLSRRTLRPATRSELPTWQVRVFIFLARHASDASRYFRIPTDRAVEIGTQITI